MECIQVNLFYRDMELAQVTAHQFLLIEGLME
jgi:hypothetical protein